MTRKSKTTIIANLMTQAQQNMIFLKVRIQPENSESFHHPFWNLELMRESANWPTSVAPHLNIFPLLWLDLRYDKLVAHVCIVTMLENQFWTAAKWPMTVATPFTKVILIAKDVMNFCSWANIYVSIVSHEEGRKHATYRPDNGIGAYLSRNRSISQPMIDRSML